MKFAGALALLCCSAAMQLCAQETQLGADFRNEASDFDMSCVHPAGSLFGAIGGCADVLFTGQPLHIAVGSLSPENGFGAGIALVTHYTPNEDWRLFWDFDAVATPNLSWRAGGYMTAVLIRHPKIVVLPGTAASKGNAGPRIEEMPTFHLYAQATSLNELTYFGLGPTSSLSGQAHYGMRETIIGTNAIWPIYAPLGLSLFGEVNGRMTALMGSGDTSPSIDDLYTPATAPGLAAQPAYAQFGEGVRVNPEFAGGYVRLRYSITFQEWLPGETGYSFRRFTADLSHQFPLYRGMRSLNPQEFNGPDSCLQGPTAKSCPPITRNLEGSFGLRFLYTASFIPNGDVVPFFFDPTLGGSDINGNPVLASYEDYRFRAPNLMLLRGSFEHSIYKWPIGVKFMVDEGRVALTHSDLGFDHLAHSYAAGLTVHAGGLPVMDLLFAWGGHEGTHTIASVSNALLGGTDRPSLY